MQYELPELKYEYTALEPNIDEQTMRIHHTKHHQTYVDNLNKLVDQYPEMKEMSAENILINLSKVPAEFRNSVQKNIGGHYNHSLYWITMGPNKGGLPTAKLADKIEDQFGSFEKFKEEFTTSALSVMGGWAWLVLDKNDKLSIVATQNQDNPLSDGLRPILGIDVWEHSYYLKYQNRRIDYINNWWNVVDWNAVEYLMG
jgi:superoxide dismutase, Fe-Mn family